MLAVRLRCDPPTAGIIGEAAATGSARPAPTTGKIAAVGSARARHQGRAGGGVRRRGRRQAPRPAGIAALARRVRCSEPRRVPIAAHAAAAARARDGGRPDSLRARPAGVRLAALAAAAGLHRRDRQRAPARPGPGLSLLWSASLGAGGTSRSGAQRRRSRVWRRLSLWRGRVRRSPPGCRPVHRPSWSPSAPSQLALVSGCGCRCGCGGSGGACSGPLRTHRRQIAAFPAGLPVGATAPGFALPDLHGATHTLESLLARGRPVALVFVAPGCGPCQQMLPELGRWQAALADRLTVAVISRGNRSGEPPGRRGARHRESAPSGGHGGDERLSRPARRLPPLIVTPDGAIGSSVVCRHVDDRAADPPRPAARSTAAVTGRRRAAPPVDLSRRPELDEFVERVRNLPSPGRARRRRGRGARRLRGSPASSRCCSRARRWRGCSTARRASRLQRHRSARRAAGPRAGPAGARRARVRERERADRASTMSRASCTPRYGCEPERANGSAADGRPPLAPAPAARRPPTSSGRCWGRGAPGSSSTAAPRPSWPATGLPCIWPRTPPSTGRTTSRRSPTSPAGSSAGPLEVWRSAAQLADAAGRYTCLRRRAASRPGRCGACARTRAAADRRADLGDPQPRRPAARNVPPPGARAGARGARAPRRAAPVAAAPPRVDHMGVSVGGDAGRARLVAAYGAHVLRAPRGRRAPGATGAGSGAPGAREWESSSSRRSSGREVRRTGPESWSSESWSSESWSSESWSLESWSLESWSLESWSWVSWVALELRAVRGLRFCVAARIRLAAWGRAGAGSTDHRCRPGTASQTNSVRRT